MTNTHMHTQTQTGMDYRKSYGTALTHLAMTSFPADDDNEAHEDR